MTAVQILVDLRSRRVRVWCEADKLKWQAPRGTLTNADKEALAERKAELLGLLSGPLCEASLRDDPPLLWWGVKLDWPAIVLASSARGPYLTLVAGREAWLLFVDTCTPEHMALAMRACSRASETEADSTASVPLEVAA